MFYLVLAPFTDEQHVSLYMCALGMYCDFTRQRPVTNLSECEVTSEMCATNSFSFLSIYKISFDCSSMQIYIIYKLVRYKSALLNSAEGI